MWVPSQRRRGPSNRGNQLMVGVCWPSSVTLGPCCAPSPLSRRSDRSHLRFRYDRLAVASVRNDLNPSLNWIGKEHEERRRNGEEEDAAAPRDDTGYGKRVSDFRGCGQEHGCVSED